MKSALLYFKALLFQKERAVRVGREAGWILAGQITSVLGALVLVRVLTEYLTPTQYGELALGLTLAALINQVVIGGLINGIARFFSIALEAADLRRYLRASARLVFIASFIVLIFALLLLLALAHAGQSKWIGLATSVLALSVLAGLNSILSGIQNSARQRATVALHAGLDAWLKIALAISVMFFLGASSSAVVVGFALSSLIVTASQLWFVRAMLQRHLKDYTEAPSRPRIAWTQEIWKFSWPFSTWGIFTWAQQTSDRWALEVFATPAEVGTYAVVFQLGYTPIGLLSGLMLTLVQPIFYSRAGDAKDETRLQGTAAAIYRLVLVSLTLTAVAFAVSFLLHERIFNFLTSAEFRAGSYFLPWVVLAGGLFATGQLLLIKLSVEFQSHRMINLKIGTAIIGLAANFTGACLFGIEGVVGALVVFSLVFLTWALRIAGAARGVT